MRKVISIFVLLFVILGACTPRSSPTVLTPEITTSLPEPMVQTTSLPDVEETARLFLDAWQSESYQGMYDMLSTVSKDANPAEDFIKRYNDIAVTITLKELKTSILSSLTNPGSAQVAYHTLYDTAVLGQFERDMVMNLVWEDNGWKVQWEPGMIMPELSGGNRLVMEYKIPARGEIYDRNGEVLVGQTDAVALGIIPGEIISTQESTLLNELARLTGKNSAEIFASYEKAGADWYIAVGDAPAKDVDERMHILSGLGGLRMTSYQARYYYGEGISPQTIGYVQPIYAEELDQYRRAGYRGDEKVGMAGIEKWGEQYLAGVRGASLYVTDPQGQIVTRLAERPSEPAKMITTTLDSDLQQGVQKSISAFRGAVVVIEVDTGRVLAMASSPAFNPNLFNYENVNSNWLLGDIFNNTDRPLLNRAAQGVYPLGSVFKIITAAAGLESGEFTPATEYFCGYEFTELPGIVLYDWTYEKELPPSGNLTLLEGLMRSCNPYFWHIGLKLYNQNKADILPEMSRAFGLGSATGIQQVAEETGNISDTVTNGDSVQLAIGQGSMLVTPLQVANFLAAVGNGGTLYRPQLVEKITDIDGNAVMEFAPEIKNQLPVSLQNLKAIQDGMLMVVENRRGTAYQVFTNLGIKVYAKTGTATNENRTASHAWFAGYTDENREDLPDIAIAVLAENAGEGSEIAAPIFRRVVELYFFGSPSRLFPWESAYYITRTPTPLPSATPTAGPSLTPEPTQE